MLPWVLTTSLEADYAPSLLRKNYPDGFIPIWATDNFTESTTHLMTNNSTFYEKYQEIVTGNEDSGFNYYVSTIIHNSPTLCVLGCPLPCIQTQAKTVFIEEMYKTSSSRNMSRIDIAFDNKVDTTIRDFPTFNFSRFLASLGGTLGLWLGLGILQVLDSVPITICKNISMHSI